MPMRFTYDPRKRAIYGVVEGTIRLAEFEARMRDIVGADDHPGNVRTLWDLTRADFSRADPAFFDQLIAVRGRYPQRGGARIAIIAPADLSFGMIRIYAAKSDGLPQTVRVFRDFDEGERWLLEE